VCQGKEGRWTEELFKVLEETPEDVIAQRDLFDRPPSVLKSWASGNTVMIGDAVHPMMPNLGQGGCQAIEDAYVLAQRLSKVTDRNDIGLTLQVPASCMTQASGSLARGHAACVLDMHAACRSIVKLPWMLATREEEALSWRSHNPRELVVHDAWRGVAWGGRAESVGCGAA
jgi:hypothetical protein